MPDDQGTLSDAEKSHMLGWDEDTLDLDDGGEPAPETPPVAGPAPTTPEVAPVGTPTGQPAPTAPDYQTLYTQQQADAQRQTNDTATRDQINTQAGQYRNQLVTSGQMDEAGANEAARQYATAEWHRFQYERSERDNESLARNEVARQIASKYNIGVQDISGQGTPQAMETAAARISHQNTEFTALKEQVKSINLTPVQNFDSGQNGGGPSDAQRKMDYALGNTDLTTEEFRQLYG